MYVSRNTETRSCDHCYHGKAVLFIYSECVSVALGMQHTKPMRYIIYWHLRPGLLNHFFSTLSHKRYDFGKKTLSNIKCVC